MAVRTLSTTAVLIAIAAAIPGAASAAAPGGAGLRYQRAIYSDLAEVALRNPEGVACDDKGALVIADTGNARLLTFSWKDGALEGGTQVKLAQLPYPVRVQIDSKGFVFALDRRARRIVKIDAKGAFAGYVEPQGATSPVTPASFKIGPGDAMYVLDVAAHKALVLNSDGRVTRELPLPKAGGITDIAADSAGRMFLVDGVSATVFAADPGANAFQAISPSMKEMISFPNYLTSDNRGKLYLVDQNGNAVVRVGVDGTFLGRELAMGWNEGGVYYPQQLCINGEGDVFLADRNNHRIQIFVMPR
jgi:sugar lactone lactonase YvrE